MNAALRISLSSIIFWLVFMFIAKVGLFGCSAARFWLLIRLWLLLLYEVQRAILIHAHPNGFGFAIGCGLASYGQFIFSLGCRALCLACKREAATFKLHLLFKRWESCF